MPGAPEKPFSASPDNNYRRTPDLDPPHRNLTTGVHGILSPDVVASDGDIATHAADTSTHGAAEILAYGTAVIIEDITPASHA